MNVLMGSIYPIISKRLTTMKKLLLFLTVVLSSALIGYSQTDSTILHYKYIEDKDMINICELSDIQIQKIYCEDTLLKGKVFNFIIKEFKKTSIATHTFSNSSLVFLPSKKVNPGNCKQSHYLRPILYLIPRLSM